MQRVRRLQRARGHRRGVDFARGGRLQDRRARAELVGRDVRVSGDRIQRAVVVERLVKHPVYEKFIRRQTKMHAHDEKNEARVGDTVEIVATRPLSKLKRFRLQKIVHRIPVD